MQYPPVLEIDPRQEKRAFHPNLRRKKEAEPRRYQIDLVEVAALVAIKPFDQI